MKTKLCNILVAVACTVFMVFWSLPKGKHFDKDSYELGYEQARKDGVKGECTHYFQKNGKICGAYQERRGLYFEWNEDLQSYLSPQPIDARLYQKLKDDFMLDTSIFYAVKKKE